MFGKNNVIRDESVERQNRRVIRPEEESDRWDAAGENRQ